MSYDLSEEFLSFGLGPGSSDANAGTTRGGSRFRPSSFDDEEYVCSPSDWWKLSIKDPIEANDIRFVGPCRKDSWEYREVQKILEGAQDSNKGFNWQPLLCRDALKDHGNELANVLKGEDGLSVFVAFTRSTHPRPEGNPCAVMLSIMVVDMRRVTNAYVHLLCSGVPTMGGRLLAYALTKLKSDNQKLESVSLHPTQRAKGFYEKLRFTSTGGGSLVFDFKTGLPVHIAAINNDEVVLRTLLKEIPTTVDATDKRGRTPLALAAYYGHEGIVKVLLKAGADVNRAGERGETALMTASKKGHEAIVRALLEAGADVNKADKVGATALLISTQEGHEAAVRVLLERGADVNKVGKVDWTPLALAAENGHEAIVRALLEKGADVNEVDEEGATPLLFAAENGHEAVVKALLDAKADVNQAEKDGWTPLLVAAENGHEAVVRALLEKGADVNEANKEGTNPLYVATNESVASALKEMGAVRRSRRLQKMDRYSHVQPHQI